MWTPVNGQPAVPRDHSPGRALTKAQKRHSRNEQRVPLLEPRSLSINDHCGNEVILAWFSKRYSHDKQRLPPPFPFQVYVSKGADHAAQDLTTFAERFASYLERIGGLPDNNRPCQHDSCSDVECHYHAGYQNRDASTARTIPESSVGNYRFDVYAVPNSNIPDRIERCAVPGVNILGCIEHQQREIIHRNGVGLYPRVLKFWTLSGVTRRRIRILIVDRDDWEDAGPLLVEFDARKYLDSGRLWTDMMDDTIVVQAERVRARSTLRTKLKQWWLEAGQEWTEADLSRRNEGGLSPAIYPAMDPVARFDIEHDAESPDNASDSRLLCAASDGDIEGTERSGEDGFFNTGELYKRASQLKHWSSKIYYDSFGLPVTSVWNPQMSITRPTFAVTLYVAFDLLCIEPKALFTCLNKGLLTLGSWSLDVVHNLPSLEAAFDYHTHNSVRRTSEKIAAERKHMPALLNEVMGRTLPVEIVEYIETLIIPPEIPNYSNRPTRPYQDIFLYLDEDHISTGPLLVYSNPASFGQDNEESIVDAFSDRERWRTEQFQGQTSCTSMLQVHSLEKWLTVAEEIHTLWSFCAPRYPTSDMPHIVSTIKLPKIMLNGELEYHFALNAEWALRSSEPIVVPSGCPLSHSLLCMFDVVDLRTGRTLPQIADDPTDFKPGLDKWSYFPDTTGWSEEDIDERITQTRISPGPIRDLFSDLVSDWEVYRAKEELMIPGQSYRLKLSENVVLRRWTYGTAAQPRGPYNLPPIPVVMSEDSQLTFCYGKQVV